LEGKSFTAEGPAYVELSDVLPDDKFGQENGSIGARVALSSVTTDSICVGGRWACDLFTVFGFGIDPRTGGETLVLKTLDSMGVVRTITLPRGVIAGNDAPFASYCADRGFRVSTEKIARRDLQALLGALKGPRITLTEKTGWVRDTTSFVMPSGKVIGDTSRRVIFTADKSETANAVSMSGDYDTCKRIISKTTSGNSRLELALCAGLCSPLMPYTSDPRCVTFSIYGESSLGKTTSGFVFGSVWGDARYARSWKASESALMAHASEHSGLGLSLDEIQHCPTPDVAYTLSEGEEKARLTSDSKQRLRRKWQCLIWSTGEKRLDDIVAENWKTKDSGTQSGREARFFDIPVTASGSIRGIVESLNGFVKSEALVEAVSDLAREHYGHAGPEFVQKIAHFVKEHGKETLKSKVATAANNILEAFNLSDEANPLVKRVAKSFAQVGAAGVIAAEFGVIDNKPDDLVDGVVKCFNDWLAVRGSQFFTQADIKPIVALRDFIQERKHQFLNPDRSDHYNGQGVVGYSKVIGGRPCYLLTNKSWDAAQKLGKCSDLAKSLDERGLLVKPKDGKRKVQIRVNGGSGGSVQDRFYAVSTDILHVDEFGTLQTDRADDEDAFGDGPKSGRLKVTIEHETSPKRSHH
jgi:putative DNA primase/helicase